MPEMEEIEVTSNNQVNEVAVPQKPSIVVPQKPTIEVLCERGEFGFGGQMYHHDRLDLETTEMLIKRGYPYLKIK